jgi:hypothetical protein
MKREHTNALLIVGAHWVEVNVSGKFFQVLVRVDQNCLVALPELMTERAGPNLFLFCRRVSIESCVTWGSS